MQSVGHLQTLASCESKIKRAFTVPQAQTSVLESWRRCSKGRLPPILISSIGLSMRMELPELKKMLCHHSLGQQQIQCRYCCWQSVPDAIMLYRQSRLYTHVQDQSRAIASLKHNRDKWRARAYKLKDMCKQLQLRVQQDSMSTWKSPDSFAVCIPHHLPSSCGPASSGMHMSNI